jgi:DNA-binding transcriptional regulator YiaG
MAKEPVKRKAPMFAVKGSAGSTTDSGFNTNPVQPELCHGSESIPRQSNDVGSKPRKTGDIAVGQTPFDVDPTLSQKVADDRGLISPTELRDVIKGLGMTQKQFAEFIMTPHDTVKGWLKGKYHIHGAAATVAILMHSNPSWADVCRKRGWKAIHWKPEGQ